MSAGEYAMEAARLDCEIAEAIMDNLRRCDYDLILVDNCNTLKDTTVIPLEKSDLILLILSLDTSTVQDARNFLDVLSEFRIDKSNIRMVINQVPLDDKKCELGISHVARILTMEPTCIILTSFCQIVCAKILQNIFLVSPVLHLPRPSFPWKNRI
mgnify:CR=1 FL=1